MFFKKIIFIYQKKIELLISPLKFLIYQIKYPQILI